MPAFAESLSDEQVLDAIAWFQSRWSDEIYAAWNARDTKDRASRR
jgi:mono/diheme cytochrome c family protein